MLRLFVCPQSHNNGKNSFIFVVCERPLRVHYVYKILGAWDLFSKRMSRKYVSCHSAKNEPTFSFGNWQFSPENEKEKSQFHSNDGDHHSRLLGNVSSSISKSHTNTHIKAKLIPFIAEANFPDVKSYSI